jgi:hypothetical protein
MREGCCARNPALDVRAPKQEAAAHHARCGSDGPAAGFRADDSLSARDKAIMELFYSSGLRLASSWASICLARPQGPHRARARQGQQDPHRAGRPSGLERCGWLKSARGAGQAPPSSSRRCSSAAAAGALRRAVQLRVAPGRAGRGSACTSTRTCSAIPLRPICSSPAAICAACRSCSDTPTSAPPRSTPTWISSTWQGLRRRASARARRRRRLKGLIARPHQHDHDPKRIYGTTILAVRRNGRVAVGGDGQVTLGRAS